jgi:hypothetical protein
VQTLRPQTLVYDATSLDLRGFLARYGDAPFLLVRVSEGDTEMELGLAAATPSTRPGRAATPKPLPFNTGFQEEPRPAPGPRPGVVDPRSALRQRLEKDSYIAVPLHKREDSDAMSMERISVGRAHNKDIVLRHSSISKFHAWFEVDEAQTVYVSDAGSTNGTQVNGRLLTPKTTTAVAAGDSIHFGAIETVLCSPHVLWSCLNMND